VTQIWPLCWCSPDHRPNTQASHYGFVSKSQQSATNVLAL